MNDVEFVRDLSYALRFKALLSRRLDEREAVIAARGIIEQLKLCGWRFAHDGKLASLRRIPQTKSPEALAPKHSKRHSRTLIQR